MYKRRRMYFQGSATIELSLIMPIIVFLIWHILFLAFFVYDQSVIFQGNYCTALRTERFYGTEGEKETEAERKYEEAVEKRVVFGTLKKTITVAEDVTVETVFSMKSPAGKYFHGKWEGVHQQKAEKWQPVAFIRNCRKAENILDNLENEIELTGAVKE